MLQISMVIILLGMPNIFVANSYERMRNISGFCVLTRANHRNCTNIRKQKQKNKQKQKKKNTTENNCSHSVLEAQLQRSVCLIMA